MTTEIKTNKEINILLIEDDQIDRENIRRNLSKTDLKHSLTEVDNVDKGIFEIQNHNYDIIFLDYHLSGKNGIELLKFFKSFITAKDIAVIVISLTDDEEIIFECLTMGAQDFISKENITPLGLKRAIFNAQVKSNLQATLKQSNLKLKELVEKDGLTGLSNRYHFNNYIDEHFQSSETDRNFALILLDIDSFKTINELYGYDTGDKLLKEFAQTIKNALPNGVLIARVGVDEFAIFLDTRVYETQQACYAIQQSLDKYVSIGEAYQKISAGIGYAITPKDAKNPTQLFQCAGMALHFSKNSANRTYYGFSSSMFRASREKTELKSLIRQAHKDNGFSLQYQPIIDSSNDSMIGFEALMRLKHQGSFIPPDKFIPVLEQMKLIHKMGYWLIEEVIKQKAIWAKKSRKKFKVSINLSPVQLNSEKIINFIFEMIKKYKVDPELITFELTETVLLDNPSKIKLILKRISADGCRIALDDFGTGFSSLSHLKEFPIDVVKIDKSMLPKNKQDKKTIDITTGLVKMLKSLKLDIVAEGIETKYQLDFCKQLEIPKLQGYLFDYPMVPDDVTKKYFNWKKSMFKKIIGG